MNTVEFDTAVIVADSCESKVETPRNFEVENTHLMIDVPAVSRTPSSVPPGLFGTIETD